MSNNQENSISADLERFNRLKKLFKNPDEVFDSFARLKQIDDTISNNKEAKSQN